MYPILSYQTIATLTPVYAVTIWPAAGQIASPSRKRYLTGRRSNSLKYYQMLFGRLPICKLNSKTRTLFDRLPVIL